MAVLCNFYHIRKEGHNMTKFLNMASQARKLFITCYPEQVIPVELRNQLFPESSNGSLKRTNPNFWETPDGRLILKKCKEKLQKIADQNKDFWKMNDICHDSDMTVDKHDKTKIVHKKDHFHIVIWRVDEKRFRVDQAVKALGLHFDGVRDANLMDKGAFQSVRNLKHALKYELHTTKKSQLDGKYQYSVNDLITNLSTDEIKNIYQAEVKDELSDDDWDELRKMSYKCGENLHDFDHFADTHFNTRQQSQSPFRVVRKSYEKGLKYGISKCSDLPRLAVIIQGAGNVGKSFNTKLACKEMGLKVCEATYGSGKYDNLTANDDVLLFDDEYASQIIEVSDNRPVAVRRRNTNNSPWTGQYMIVLTNKDCDTWLKLSAKYPTENGEIRQDYQSTFDALRQRFIFCHVEWGDYKAPTFDRTNDVSHDVHIVLDKLTERGGDKYADIHKKMYDDLISHIEKHMKEYYYQKWVEHFQKQGNIDLSDYWKQVNQPQKSVKQPKNKTKDDDFIPLGKMTDKEKQEFDDFIKEQTKYQDNDDSQELDEIAEDLGITKGN